MSATSLARTQRIKLVATSLNTIALATTVSGGVLPLIAYVNGTGPVRFD